jgi:hypothetical protein
MDQALVRLHHTILTGPFAGIGAKMASNVELTSLLRRLPLDPSPATLPPPSYLFPDGTGFSGEDRLIKLSLLEAARNQKWGKADRRGLVWVPLNQIKDWLLRQGIKGTSNEAIVAAYDWEGLQAAVLVSWLGRIDGILDTLKTYKRRMEEMGEEDGHIAKKPRKETEVIGEVHVAPVQ